MHLFHPQHGVPLRPHKRMMRVYYKSFTAAELVDAISERGNFRDRARAAAVARRMQKMRIITKVGRPAAFEDGHKLYQSALAEEAHDAYHAHIVDATGSTLKCWDKAGCSADMEPYRRVELKIACDMVDLQSVDFWSNAVYLRDPVKGYLFGYRSIAHPLACPRIMCIGGGAGGAGFLDANALGALNDETIFSSLSSGSARHSIASSPGAGSSSGASPSMPHPDLNPDSPLGKLLNGPALNGTADASADSDSASEGDSSFGGSTLRRTFSSSARSTSSGSLTGLMDGAFSARSHRSDPSVINSAKVVKVFSSIARPMIIELSRLRDDGGEVGLDDDHDKVGPLLLVKEGDNLGQDLCVELLFRVFNSIWRCPVGMFKGRLESAPFAVEYEVFPTSSKQGFMEAVSGLTSLKDFDWDSWVAMALGDPYAVRRMIASAAGSYIGAYILGAADRHTENVQIKDGNTMLHIDFGFLLGSQPPIDGPQIAIYPEMEAAFRKVSAWDTFVDMCVDTFIAVRRAAPSVIRTAVIIFSRFGFPPETVRDYMAGPLSLNTREPYEKVAAATVRNLVRHSSSDWKTKFKSYSHSNIDPLFYSALQKKFGPAVLAMKIVDSKQQAATKKLEESIGKTESVPKVATASIDEE